jgi:4-carboxymuconolactone decarboxylase
MSGEPTTNPIPFTQARTTMEPKTEHGLKIFEQLLGSERAAGMRALATTPAFGSDISTLALNYAFADVWARDGLERKQRSLITLAVLIATRQTSEIRNHVRIAIRNGLTARELEEMLVQCVPYLGFPAVASGMTPVIETLRELGIETQAKTSEERGLL